MDHLPVALALAAVLLVVGGRDAPATLAIEPRAAAPELVALSNLSRTTNGLNALLRDGQLAVVAVARSEDMLDRNYFAHQIPPAGNTVVDQLESLGVIFLAAGENIAWNNAADGQRRLHEQPQPSQEPVGPTLGSHRCGGGAAGR